LEAVDGINPVIVTPEHEASALVHGSLRRVIARIAVPAVASNLLITLFAALDTYWVGRSIGASGLAAVTTSLFWIWLVISIAEMVSIGLTAVAARRHGERRPQEAARAVFDALVFSIALGAVVAIIGVAFVDKLFEAMRAPPAVAALGREYLGIYLLGCPLLFGYFVVDAGFRASGDTRTPLLLLGIATVVTVVMDPVLIHGWWGAPVLGIRGAAIATVSFRSLAFVVGMMLLYRRGLVEWGPLRLRVLGTICRVGLPAALTGVTFSLIYVILTRTATEFGTSAIAALGLGHRIESWLFMIGVGFGASAAAVVGHSLGAGRPDRAERAGWITTSYASVPGLAFFLLGTLAPEWAAGVFTTDPFVVAETARYLRIAAWGQLVICVELVLEGALGGAGATLPPMLASTAITASRIPLAPWAAARWGTTGIWWVISMTAVARAVAMALLWKSGRWKKAKV
jgi:putative MATE family efflux protein